MQIYSMQLCFILMALMQFFASSSQNRRPHWHPLHVPNYVIGNKLIGEDDDCLSSNKCISRSRGLDRERQLSVGDIAQDLEDFNDIDVKRFVSKKYSTEEMIPMPPSSGSKVEEGRGIFFKSSRPPSCSCDIRYELIDLHATGHRYYPRYVPSAVCTTEICWNSLYKCRPKYYKMYFLKHREEPLDDMNDTLHADQGPLVPESLKKDWTFVSIPVAVSCECLP